MRDLTVTSDRRRAVRRAPADDDPVARVRLRAGGHLTVVDVSNGGVLVEGGARLLPGTHVDVHVISPDGRLLVRSRVVRAYVSHVEAERIRYRGALAFEREVETRARGYPVPAMLAPAVVEGIVSPDDGRPLAPADVDGVLTSGV